MKKEHGRFVQEFPLEERFWSKVARSDVLGECWEWQANTNGGALSDDFPYGRFKIDGRNVLAHRVAWELTYGPIPEGLWVLHHCDNPRCVNPKHLFLGTRSDNMRDAGFKRRLHNQIDPYWTLGDRNPSRRHPERLRRGIGCHQAKLTEHDVREIRRRHPAESFRALGRAFGITDTTVRALVHRRTWRHVA